MENQKKTPKSRPTRKKRKLRKQAKITLSIAAIVICCLLGWGIWAFVQNSSNSQAEKQISKDTQSQDSTQQDSTSSEDNEPSKDPDSLLTTYPDNNEEKTTILLDAGHGGYDPGNVVDDVQTGEEYLEKDINLDITKKIEANLKKTNPNLEVLMVRDSDETSFNADGTADEMTDLDWRVDLQTPEDTNEPVDYFISIHSNALVTDPSVIGYNFFIKPKDTVMVDMANQMAENLEKVNWSEDNGILYTDDNPLQVISFSPTHAMLIEVGYMTNEEELNGLLNSAETDKIAEALAAAISDYIMENPDSKNIESPAQIIPDQEKAAGHISDQTNGSTSNSSSQNDSAQTDSSSQETGNQDNASDAAAQTPAA